MTISRREFLILSNSSVILALAAAAGVISPAKAQEDRAVFNSKSLDSTVKALGVTGVAEGKQITLVAPDIAENGAVVQVEISSTYPNTQLMAILVDKNPNALASLFEFPDGTDGFLHTRIKMNETSNVVALVKADNKYYLAKREIKITLGGCG